MRTRVLTLTQPWATLVAIGEKRIETRSWGTRYRGPLAIHAAKTLNGIGPKADEAALEELCATEPFAEILATYRLTPEQLPRGTIVATCRVLTVVPMELVRQSMEQMPVLEDFEPADHERAFGDYAPGRYAWFLGARELVSDRVEVRGQPGMFLLPEELEGRLHRVEAL